MPYLDHSCWPTHFNTKRLVVDSILNATTETFAQVTTLNKSLQLNSPAMSRTSSKLLIAKKKDIPQRSKKNQLSSSNPQNSIRIISFEPTDNSTDVNNRNEFDPDESFCDSETTSGRFTQTNNTVSPTYSESAVDFTLKNQNDNLK